MLKALFFICTKHHQLVVFSESSDGNHQLVDPPQFLEQKPALCAHLVRLRGVEGKCGSGTASQRRVC